MKSKLNLLDSYAVIKLTLLDSYTVINNNYCCYNYNFLLKAIIWIQNTLNIVTRI